MAQRFLIFLLLISNVIIAKNKTPKQDEDSLAITVASLKFRSIGPTLTSGRISDFAVNSKNTAEYYVATAGGGIWKTENNGTTFKPVFDTYGSYSIGCIKMSPENHNVLWAGTGENNAQRSVSCGDGVYKTIDGGKHWKNMGLRQSRQIGDIEIDPRNPNVVYVAAEGSVWGSGGDRGLFKTIDGGKSWEKILNISENTGVKNIAMDPVNPDIIYVSSSQRRRHTNIRIGGGPEVAIYKTEDAGKTWRKLTNGLPKVDKGGIDIAVSPIDHNIVYAIVEAAEGKGGFFRSENRGETWKKMSNHNTSGQYFCEIYCDPKQKDKLYSMDTYSAFTVDGGKTWKKIGNNKRHVDDHAFWIDQNNTNHFMIGGDGGVYETFDAGKNFIYKTNLPITQFYRVAVDNTKPFYWVYGGTQDNNSLGGPSASLYSDGVISTDWIVTLGGDGFWQAIDTTNPDIVYSEYQYGNIYRYDRKSDERLYIRPQPKASETSFRWNWNTPFIISSHHSNRLYIAANKVFRSDDRGNTWTEISGDISRQLPRDKWPVMGRYWSVDGVAKNVSTSLYGMAVELAESPKNENLLFVGTDDGLIQITEDGGKHWQKIETFPTVPEYSYVADILPSKFDENIVFAAFDNHKRDDFKPYILKSEDKGHSWHSITGNLPDSEVIHTIEQDFINPNLLFAGTEHGLYVSLDGGMHWTRMKNGLPTVAVRDIAIQRQENDLVLATFGRGFYILDNYEPLRKMSKAIFDKDAYLFPVKKALLYVPKRRGGAQWGSMPYVAKNPPFGATFTLYEKTIPKTLKEIRQEKEKKLIKDKKPLPIPTPLQLKEEENEVAPYLIIDIKDSRGKTVYRFTKKPKKGIMRFNWDLHIEEPYPIEVAKFNPLKKAGHSYLALPGTYTVSISRYQRGQIVELIKEQPFEVVPLNLTTLPAEKMAEVFDFEQKTIELAKDIYGTKKMAKTMLKELLSMKQAVVMSPNIPHKLIVKMEAVEKELNTILWKFEGEKPKASLEERTPAKPTIDEMLNNLVYTHRESFSDITATQRQLYADLHRLTKAELMHLKQIRDTVLTQFEITLNQHNVRYTPNRFPEIK